MSLASTTNRVNYTGNGLVAVYPYTFKILDDDHLRVVVRDLDGAETTLTKTTHYTVSGVGNTGGGNVSLVAGSFDWLTSNFLTTGFKLTIRRVVDLKQETDIRNQGEYYAELHEDALDKVTMVNQQQQDELNRSIKASETETMTLDALPDATTRASQFVGFDADGQVIVGQPTGVPVTAFMQTVLDDTTAADARTTLGFDGASGVVALGDLAAAIVAKLVPAGSILDFGGSSAPTGYVLCDGSSYDGSTATYSALFAAIGNTWDTFNGQVAPGGALFRVPKLNGMVTIGVGAAQTGTVATTIRALAAVGGAESLPAHTHAVSITSGSENVGHTHSGTTGSSTTSILVNAGNAGGGGQTLDGNYANNNGTITVNILNDPGHTHSFTTGGISANHNHLVSGNTASTGTGTHGVMQPFAAVNKIIKL